MKWSVYIDLNTKGNKAFDGQDLCWDWLRPKKYTVCKTFLGPNRKLEQLPETDTGWKQINSNHNRERSVCERFWNIETSHTGMDRSTLECQVRTSMIRWIQGISMAKDKCHVYLTMAKQGLISREHVICFDIWFVVIFQQMFLFRKLDFVKWNFYLSYFHQFLFNFLQKYKKSFSFLSINTPAPSNSLHLDIKLSLCLNSFLSSFSELPMHAETSHH